MSQGGPGPFDAPPPSPPPGMAMPPAGGFGADNPYRPPATFAPGTIDPPGAGLKWLFLAGHGCYWVFSIGGTVALSLLAEHAPDRGQSLLVFLPALSTLFALGAFVAAMVWIYKAWASIPEPLRRSDGGRWITPGAAVGYLFMYVDGSVPRA